MPRAETLGRCDRCRRNRGAIDHEPGCSAHRGLGPGRRSDRARPEDRQDLAGEYRGARVACSRKPAGEGGRSCPGRGNRDRGRLVLAMSAFFWTSGHLGWGVFAVAVFSGLWWLLADLVWRLISIRIGRLAVVVAG